MWLMRPKKLRTEKGQEIIFVGAGLCGVCLYYLFENIALTYTQASNVSVIVSTAPLFVTIMAHFFLKEEKLQKYFFSDLCVPLPESFYLVLAVVRMFR